MPIEITWYEGDYSRSYVISENRENGRKSRVNYRQIRIFMNEEYDYAVQNIVNLDYSVSVLTPYRGQLYALREAIDDYNKKAGLNLVVDISSDIGKTNQDDDGDEEDVLYALTIHKSQGTEFDIVYILTVDDDARSHKFDFPWTQNRRLINVATSRAKQELHIITSVNLMSAAIQRRLVGYTVNSGHLSSNKDYFVEKLIDYAYDYYKSKPNLEECGFGFHRARTYSVFDKKTYQKHIDGVDLNSSNEDCVKEALDSSDMIRKMSFKVWYEYPIWKLISENAFAGKIYNSLGSERMKNFLSDQRTHMDFPITTANGTLLLVVEVDGEWHNDDDDQAERDIMKDEFLKKLGIPVLRFRDDGNRFEDDDDKGLINVADIVSDELNEMDHLTIRLIEQALKLNANGGSGYKTIQLK